MAYESKCGSCDFFEDGVKNEAYDETNANYVKGFCSWYGAYYYPDDSCDKNYRKRGSSSSSNCYITTILCHRLGLDDDCDQLQTLRKFRKNVLQKNDQYKDILFEYDTVGPLIAKGLEKEDMLIIRGLQLSYIEPVVNFIKEGANEKAIERYKEMTKLLKAFYQIEKEEEIPQDYDISQGGHGKLVKKMK